MRVLLSIVMLPLIAACSTVRPAPAPSAAVAETSGPDVAGRWIGHWTGAGLFDSYREDDVTVDLVQQGDAAVGRIVMQGTTAAESVPEVIRRGGQWGNQVFARVKPGTVTLRHYIDGRLFTVDFRLAEDGEHMTGLVRDSHPKIGLTLTRAPRQVARETPAPTPAVRCGLVFSREGASGAGAAAGGIVAGCGPRSSSRSPRSRRRKAMASSGRRACPSPRTGTPPSRRRATPAGSSSSTTAGNDPTSERPATG